MKRIVMIGALLTAAVPLAAQTQPTDEAAVAEEEDAATSGDFADYDTDRSGQLDQSEFTSWFLAAKQRQLAAEGTGASQAELTGQVQRAFADADADKSQTISRQELNRFVAG